MFSWLIPKQDLAVSSLGFISSLYTEIYSVAEVILHNSVLFTGNVQFILINEKENYEILVLDIDITEVKDFIWYNESIAVPVGYKFKLIVTGDIGEIEGIIVLSKR
ncbi:MAG: hypothetical protein KJ648_06865 [Candidatus Omnitrophica bacterium]|nr:hypothetical protein [Candidatus Omnitrophota bacterium]